MTAEDFIGHNYEKLSKSEKKIADFLGAEPKTFIGMTMREISEKVGTGEATIVRFLKKCGYDSLMELRYDTVRKLEKNHSDIAEEPIKQLSELMENDIAATAKNLDPKLVNQAALLLKKADHVYCYGIGQSGLAAEVAAYRAMRFGRQAQYVTDIHYQSITSYSCSSKDVIFAFSGGGISPELLSSVKIAKENGAQIVAFSGNGKYGLVELADIFFLCEGRRAHLQPAGSGIDILTTLIFAFEIVVMRYTANSADKSRAIAEKITIELSRNREN